MNGFSVGLGMRAAAITMMFIGADTRDTDDRVGYVMLGVIGLVSGAVLDFAATGRSVREYNFEYAKRRLTPVVAPAHGPDGTAQLRIGLAGSF